MIAIYILLEAKTLNDRLLLLLLLRFSLYFSFQFSIAVVAAAKKNKYTKTKNFLIFDAKIECQKYIF